MDFEIYSDGFGAAFACATRDEALAMASKIALLAPRDSLRLGSRLMPDWSEEPKTEELTKSYELRYGAEAPYAKFATRSYAAAVKMGRHLPETTKPQLWQIENIRIEARIRVDVVDERAGRTAGPFRTHVTAGMDSDGVHALLRRVRPIVRHGDWVKEILIEGIDPNEIAFTWAPKFSDELIAISRLLPLGSVVSLHAFGAPMFFKPSLREVAAQIPPMMALMADFVEVVPPEDATQVVVIDEAGEIELKWDGDHERAVDSVHMAALHFYKRLDRHGDQLCDARVTDGLLSPIMKREAQDA